MTKVYVGNTVPIYNLLIETYLKTLNYTLCRILDILVSREKWKSGITKTVFLISVFQSGKSISILFHTAYRKCATRNKGRCRWGEEWQGKDSMRRRKSGGRSESGCVWCRWVGCEYNSTSQTCRKQQFVYLPNFSSLFPAVPVYLTQTIE